MTKDELIKKLIELEYEFHFDNNDAFIYFKKYIYKNMYIGEFHNEEFVSRVYRVKYRRSDRMESLGEVETVEIQDQYGVLFIGLLSEIDDFDKLLKMIGIMNYIKTAKININND